MKSVGGMYRIVIFGSLIASQSSHSEGETLPHVIECDEKLPNVVAREELPIPVENVLPEVYEPPTRVICHECSHSRKQWWKRKSSIAFILVICIIVAVFVGVIASKVGTRATLSTDPPASSPSASLTPTSSNTTNSKISSITTTTGSVPQQRYVFYMATGTLDIRLSVYSGDKWHDYGEVKLKVPPKSASPLTAVGWKPSENEVVQIFYLDDAGKVVSVVAECFNNGTRCVFEDDPITVGSGVSTTSGLAAVLIPRENRKLNIQIFCQDMDGTLSTFLYEGTEWFKANHTFPEDIMYGTSLAALKTELENNFTTSLWYRDRNQVLKTINYHNASWSNPIDIPITRNTSTIPSTARMAATGISSPSLFMVQENGDPIVITKMGSQNVGDMWLAYVHDQPPWKNSDERSGSIAGLSWHEDDYTEHTRIYYSADGSLQEIALDQGVTSQGRTFPS